MKSEIYWITFHGPAQHDALITFYYSRAFWFARTLYTTHIQLLKKRNDSLWNNLTQLLNICSIWACPLYNPKGEEGREMCATKKALRQTSENAWLSLRRGYSVFCGSECHRFSSFDSIIALKLSCGCCHDIWNSPTNIITFKRRRLPPIMAPLIGEVPTWGKFMRTMSLGQIRTTPMFFIRRAANQQEEYLSAKIITKSLQNFAFHHNLCFACYNKPSLKWYFVFSRLSSTGGIDRLQ